MDGGGEDCFVMDVPLNRSHSVKEKKLERKKMEKEIEGGGDGVHSILEPKKGTEKEKEGEKSFVSHQNLFHSLSPPASSVQDIMSD